jgi:hypothetical protein
MFINSTGPRSTARTARTDRGTCFEKTAAISVALALLLSACAGHPLSEATKGEKNVFRMIGYQKKDEQKVIDLLSIDPKDTELPNVLRAFCQLPEPKPPDALAPAFVPPAAIIGVVAPLIMDAVFSKIHEAVAAEKAKYTATYSAQVSDTFYLANTEAGLRWPCFHFRRTVTEDKNQVVAVDILGAFQPSPDGAALKVLPLRTYFARAKAKVDEKGQYGVAVSLSLKGLWLNDKREPVESVRQISLINQSVALPTNKSSAAVVYSASALKYGKQSNPTSRSHAITADITSAPTTDDDPWAATGWLPSIPIPKDAKTSVAHGNFVLVATVVEDGGGKDLFALFELVSPTIEALIKKQVSDAIAKANAEKK